MTFVAGRNRNLAPSNGASGVSTSQRTVTVALAGLLLWLVLQTPVAIFLYQYLGVSDVGARALLLVKDLVVAVLIVGLAVRVGRRTAWRVFDIAAFVYVVVLGLYAVVPMALGLNLPLLSVGASVREFLVPVELYVLGRLAATVGVRLTPLAVWFLGLSAVAAAISLFLYVAFPPTFWSSTLDLVAFIREVQGIPTALSLWAASLVGHFGVGAGAADAQFPRAVAPFTHPVGTAHYFVAPLVISTAGMIAAAGAREGWIRILATTAMVVLFALAVITPISRGAWLAALVGIMLAGVLLKRTRPAIILVAAFVAFVAIVPPFSYSISSAIGLTDSSSLGHVQAIAEGVRMIVDNPLGLGPGHGDTLGEAYAEGGSAGVGENMYLAILVTTGPIGLVAFLVWVLGALGTLFRGTAPDVPRWLYVGFAALTAGLLVSSMTASPLMRFTTSASLWLLVGLAVGSATDLRPWRSILPAVPWRRKAYDDAMGQTA